MTTDAPSPCPNSETHPDVQFWSQEDFFNWLDKAAETELASCGKLAYLEDKDGNTLPESMAKGAWKVIRCGYCKLMKRGLAPKSWGKLCTTGRCLFHNIVEMLACFSNWLMMAGN
jgi:hypothetical protein